MEYIISAQVIYFLSIIDRFLIVLKICIVFLCVFLLIRFIVNFDDETVKKMNKLYFVKWIFIFLLFLSLIIPTKDTLNKMIIAKFSINNEVKNE